MNCLALRSFRDRLVAASNAPREPAKPPGPILFGFTTIAVIACVCIARNWWPSPYGRSAWLDPLVVGAVAVVVLLVAGLIWAIRTLHVIGQDRRWSWWILPAPIVVGLGTSLAVLLPQPSILDHRGEFEAVAIELLEAPPDTRERIEIGPFDISSARSTPDGEVYFTDDEGFSLLSSSGWVYAPDGPPAGFDDFTANQLDGPWYEYSSVWRD